MTRRTLLKKIRELLNPHLRESGYVRYGRPYKILVNNKSRVLRDGFVVHTYEGLLKMGW